jgi:hypothetical protein
MEMRKASRMCGAACRTGFASCTYVPAGPSAQLDRYIGSWKPYAISHDELDADEALQEEVRNAARTLVEAVSAHRAGRMVAAGQTLSPPRQK